jgi:outer membrane receptor for ferrienterochelin and colicin
MNRFVYFTDLDIKKYGAFFQMGKRFFNNRLSISSGIRTDGNSFNTYGKDFLSRLSPRLSLSYVLTDQWNVNASIGRYYKMPPLTALGFKDNNGNYVNKQSDYIGSNHYVAGVEYIPSEDQRYTAEVFYKKYFNVPMSIQKGISLSNLGADFNILGNEPIISAGKGRAYGFELFAQKKLTKKLFYVTSYSFFRSAYTNLANEYISSSWENIHVLSAQLGYKLKNNWELGIKFRFQGGTPYTPYDSATSRVNYLVLGNGVIDYSKLNTLRTKAFHSSDIRLDKKYNFKKNTLDFFIDISNWYGSMSVAPSAYYFAVNPDGSFQTTDGQPIKKDGSNGVPSLANGNQVYVTPTFGFIWQF